MHDELIEAALHKFGEARTDELKPDIESLALDLRAIREHSLSIEDEL